MRVQNAADAPVKTNYSVDKAAAQHYNIQKYKGNEADLPLFPFPNAESRRLVRDGSGKHRGCSPPSRAPKGLCP